MQLFEIEFREIRENGVAELWSTAEIPIASRATVHAKDGHASFRATYGSARRMPMAPYVTLRFMGKIVLEFQSQAGEDAAGEDAAGTWIQLNTSSDSFTIQAKITKLSEPEAPAAEAPEAPAAEAPAAEAPAAQPRGNIVAFGVSSIVVHANARRATQEPKSDLDRVLCI